MAQQNDETQPSTATQALHTGAATNATQSNAERKESSVSSSPSRRSRPTPVVTTPIRGLSGTSESSSGCDNDDDVGIASFHNSRGTPVHDRNRNRNSNSNNTNTPDIPESNASSPEAAAASADTTAAACSADQERQILLLMLLAQVCALHDPTPRTFTVHVLELFERGILGRQSIHFLFELGLVPTTTPRLLTNGETAKTTSDSKEDLLDSHMTAMTTIGNSHDRSPPSPQTLRSREASAIRSSLEQHDLAHQLMQQARSDGGANNNTDPNTFFPNNNPTLVTSPTSAASLDPEASASPNNDDCRNNNPTVSSWAVEHHPLSLSRYQREFHQVRLLNAGSFGEVFQSTNKVDLKDYAVKRVAFSAWGYSKDSVSQVIREVHCLAQCDHPNVVRYYTSWLEPSWMTGSGATMMMSTTDDTSAVEVRRQQKLLTDIQHMMVTGGSDAGADSWGEPTNQSLLSTPSWALASSSHQDQQQQEPRNHIQDFFQEQAGVLRRNRQFSIGSSMDSFHSDGDDDSGALLGESSYDETSTSEEEDEDVSAWSIEESRPTATQEDSIFFDVSHETVQEEEGQITTTREESIFFESRRKEVWESSSSPPRQARTSNNKKKNQKSAAAAARLKYRYQICLFIQMQLCHPATLGDWIRKRNSQCDEPEKNRYERVQTAANVFGQIVGGLDHIHKKGIVHRDLKPANLFRSLEEDGIFLIGDFGLSKLIHSATHHKKSKHHPPASQSATSPHAEVTSQALVIQPPTTLAMTSWQDPLTAGVGTASYAAPEQVTTQAYGMKADIFSLGLILLEMCCCFTTEHERMQTFADCRHRRDIPSWISQDYPMAAKAILDCTDPNPSNRPSAEDLLKVACQLAQSTKEGEPEADREMRSLSEVEAKPDILESVKCELEEKNAQLLDYKQKLQGKDNIILQLREELAQMRLNQGVQSQPIRGRSLDSLEVDDVASSSSSSDGCI